MHEPQNLEELALRILKNSRVEGYGAETANHMACPFCGEAEFMSVRVVKAKDDSEKGGHCDQCDRSGRFLIDDRDPGSTKMLFIQTGGPMPPHWLDGPNRPPHIHNLESQWTELL